MSTASRTRPLLQMASGEADVYRSRGGLTVRVGRGFVRKSEVCIQPVQCVLKTAWMMCIACFDSVDGVHSGGAVTVRVRT